MNNPNASPSQLRPTQRSLTMQLLNTRELTMTYFRPLLRNYNVTEQQWRVVRVLAQSPKLDLGTLATETCLLGPSLTRIIQTLVQEGLITRRPDKQDQRRFVVTLTPKGQSLYDTISPQSEAIYQHIEEKFGSAKLNRLNKLLSELSDALEPNT